jgi:hypothetical protein
MPNFCDDHPPPIGHLHPVLNLLFTVKNTPKLEKIEKICIIVIFLATFVRTS